jgi:PIN domain nuclease of toxin-antitoxin system
LRLLLDTHVLIWWARDEPLAPAAHEAIASPTNEVSVSAASVWEAGIKVTLGKLRLGRDLADETARHGFTELSVTFAHARAASQLQPHHRDPFDRMLVAQAQLEGLTLVTRDPAFRPYRVPLLAA